MNSNIFYIYLKICLTNVGYMSIIALVFMTHARVAQLVEHHLAKVRAAGSNPVSRFFDAHESAGKE